MASSANTAAPEGPLWAPWHVLRQWSPFNIDALGLVTLLGAEEINAAVGRLVASAYLEYLPLLGAYVIAGDRFTEKAAGWHLYNISQGIHTTDLAAWLTRWMLSQNFETTRNYVVWTITPPRSRKSDIIVSVLIGFVLNGLLVAGTILSADWYGFANALAMIVSIIVRVYVIGQQRLAMDAMIDKAVARFGPPTGDSYEARRYEYKSWKHQRMDQMKDGLRLRKPDPPTPIDGNQPGHGDPSGPKNGHKQAVHQVQAVKAHKNPDPKGKYPRVWKGKPIKVLIIQSDSKAVTFEMPTELVIPPSLFIEGPIVRNPRTYSVMRSLGWLAFAVHIIAIGMADLATQIYTVLLIVLPTLLLIKKTGCDDSDWMKTFTSWKRAILHSHGKASRSAGSQSAAEKADAKKFRKIRECWIGSRLKAEVYEWPEAYEFHEEGVGNIKKWVSGGLPAGEDRSKKRQDLYAWLALTRDEEESMDKWDLFPHIRSGNNSWWETYKKKKHALREGRDAMGPQYVASQGTDPRSSQDDYMKPFNKQKRLATEEFLGTAHEQASAPQPQLPAQAPPPHPLPPQPQHTGPVTATSSAFPASSDAAAAQLVTDNSATVSSPKASPPRVNTQPSTTGSALIDPSVTMTQSPTTMEATDEQP
ncbi:hypothetical protein A1O7_07605 [Cladophialophora yegresii CBS 114405]|uniref:Uncharacterized protein n=1 Tax=Cladophialophora yegresii CBS 114405 TaxID=1182544 RepID=W9VNY4_9EURO|nr:uncharacterized protein A1O7_07605 [Cladophialophora yegresii CBS 114405]EXJ57258.1 hypothetical protein A1O7_07605 [Cladophialophora yegresii CBS 114405]